MRINTIDKTNRYHFERMVYGRNSQNFTTSLQLKTCYIHKGSANLSVKKLSGIENIRLYAGEGFVVIPGTIYRLEPSKDFKAYQVSSEVIRGEPLIEIIDNGTIREEVELKDYKIIINPKKVIKPWGHELWVIWTKNHHVLKQIGMNKGSKSSLQFHRKKLETNCLESGEADVIMGYQLNPNETEKNIQKSLEGLDFNKYTKRIKPGFSWTSQPGIVHRVMAATDYIAYEVSTPELDDVIRLKDDSNRTSGRIESEHLTGELK